MFFFCSGEGAKSVPSTDAATAAPSSMVLFVLGFHLQHYCGHAICITESNSLSHMPAGGG